MECCLPSENPYLTPRMCFSFGSLHTAQPLSLTVRTCSQYFVSCSISFSSLVADARMDSTALSKLWAFHPLAICLLSALCASVSFGAANLSAPNVFRGTSSERAGETEARACGGASFVRRSDIKSSAKRED